MLVTILIIILLLFLIGALPHWPYAANYNYGYAPSGVLGLILIIVVVLLLLGRL
jgi:Protein of unknown function (DUF3309)